MNRKICEINIERERDIEGKIHSKRRNLISQELNKEVFFISCHILSSLHSCLNLSRGYYQQYPFYLHYVSFAHSLSLYSAIEYTFWVSIAWWNSSPSKLQFSSSSFFFSRKCIDTFRWNRNLFLKLQTIANKKYWITRQEREIVEGIKSHH